MINDSFIRTNLILERIELIQAKLDSIGIKSFLIDGALLGLFREGKILDWDWDCEIAFVDLSIDKKQFLEIVSLIWSTGLKVTSVSADKFLKINCLDPVINDFNFSVIGLVVDNQFYTRPRFKYPSNFFKNGGTFLNLKKTRIRVPSEPDKFLSYVYKDWKTPNHSKREKNYLSDEIYKHSDVADAFVRLKFKIERVFEYTHNLLASEILLGREPLFICQLKSLAKSHSQFLHIGSSDGKEIEITLQNSPKIQKIVIVEPNAASRKRISAILNSHNQKISKTFTKLINAAVVPSRFTRETVELWYPPGLKNLSSIKEINSFSSFKAKAMKFEQVLKEFDHELPLLITMDLEGQELEFLSESVLLDFKNISILFELHQNKYDTERILEVIKQLFDSGFYIVSIETSDFYQFPYLTENKFRKKFTIGKRSLYSVNNVVEPMDLFKLNFYLTPISPHFNSRIARSITLSNIPNLEVFKVEKLKIPYYFLFNALSILLIKSRTLIFHRKLGRF